MTIPYDVTFAANRLSEVLDGMRAVWRRSLEQSQPDKPVDVYVCDADVVTMFMAPIDSHSYGALLRHQKHARIRSDDRFKTLETRITEFLGYLIFFQLQPHIPMPMLPGHVDDLDRVLNACWKEAAKEMGTWEKIAAETRHLSESAINTSRNNLGKADEAVASAKFSGEHDTNAKVGSLLREILESLRGAGPLGQIFRVGALWSSNRVCHIDQFVVYSDPEGRQPQYLTPPLTKEGKYIPLVARFANRIYAEMLRLNPSKDQNKQFWLRRDAEAFAHLVWLNRILENEIWYVKTARDALRPIKRLTLITGSNSLRNAINELEGQVMRGRELEMHPLRDCIVAPISFLGHRIMDDYFQEESSLTVAARGEAATAGAQSSALINFFDSMRSQLEHVLTTGDNPHAQTMLSTVRLKHERLAESWQKRQLFSKESRMEVVTQAIEQLSGSGHSLEQLEHFIADLSIGAWRSFARSVTMLSFETADPDKRVRRNIPPVKLSHFPEAERISKNLYMMGDSIEARDKASKTLETSQTAIRKLNKEDPSHYTEFLCYALFGLVHRTLRSAEGCAEIAVAMAESKSIQGPLAQYIIGEEAYYLLAHIIRLRARRIEQLNRAEDCMKRAMSARKKKDFTHSDGTPEKVALRNVDMRYVSEMFSINCYRLYFESFGNVGPKGVASAMRHDVQLITSTFMKGLDIIRRIDAGELLDEDSYIREYVNQQILVNMVQLAVLSCWPPQRTDEQNVQTYRPISENISLEQYSEKFKNVARRLMEHCRMLRSSSNQPLPSASILAESVAAVGVEVFLPEEDEEEWFNPEQGKVASIDSLRFSYLINVLRRSRKERGAAEYKNARLKPVADRPVSGPKI